MSDRIRLDGAEITPPEPAPKPPPPPPEPKEPDEEPQKPDPIPPRREAAEGAPAESTDAEADSEETEAEKQRKAQDRTDRRIKDAIRRRYEAERERDLFRQQFEQMQAQLRASQPPQPGQPPLDAVEEAKRQLRAEAELREFNEACNKTFASGAAEYGDTSFRDAVGALNAVGAGTHADFLQAVTQLPDGHRLYPLLAADLDNAARILAMPAPRMAVELAKLALAAPAAEPAPESTPPPVTQAPAPIRTIRGGSARQPNPNTETMAEFIKRRDREDAEKRRI